ncbi:hypothetical protein TNCV_2385441 [Trichonephila clavipes]|nr:hypothetical protein TNCV_2385441 [Trichonephila clavipes]
MNSDCTEQKKVFRPSWSLKNAAPVIEKRSTSRSGTQEVLLIEEVYRPPCKENGVVVPVLRETGASLGIGFEKCAALEMFTGEQGLVKHIHDDTMTCLQPAGRKIECEPVHVVSKAIVSPGHLNGEKYFLENQTIELLEPDLEQNGLPRPEIGNEMQTRRERRKEAEKSIRLENEKDQFRLRGSIVGIGENFVPFRLQGRARTIGIWLKLGIVRLWKHS